MRAQQVKPRLTILTNIDIIKVGWINPCVSLLILVPATYSYIAKAQILILLFSLSTFATSIVAVRTNSEVVIGADSRGLFVNGAVTYRNVCKIHERNGVFFAIAGIEVDPITKFNAGTIVEAEIDKRKSLSSRVSAIEKILSMSVARELEWQRTRRPDLYRRTVENNNMVLSVVFAGLENGTPALYARAFKTDGTILREDHPSGTFTLWMGKANAIEKFVGETKGRNLGTPADAVRRLIQLEIDDNEPSVGPPIDIVRITKDGAQWIQVKPECEEKKTPKPKPAMRRRGRRK